MRRIVKNIILVSIDIYRHMLSPLLPVSCRFMPTCSVYAKESVERHGTSRGILLTIKRLLKCHPFHPGGYDPVR